MAATLEMTNVFQFMEIRVPFSPEAKALRQNYIRDDFIELSDKPVRKDTDLQSDKSPVAGIRKSSQTRQGVVGECYNRITCL